MIRARNDESEEEGKTKKPQRRRQQKDNNNKKDDDNTKCDYKKSLVTKWVSKSGEHSRSSEEYMTHSTTNISHVPYGKSCEVMTVMMVSLLVT